MNSLQGKAIVVTGAARGIGATVAKLAAAEGALVVVNDLDAGPAEQITDEITRAGGKAVTHAADISDWKGAQGLIQRCVDTYGRIDGLANIAGLFAMERIDELTEASIRSLFSVNVMGTAFTARHAAAHMARQKSGSIVNVTSGAQMGLAAMGSYGGTKGAVAAFTYTWATDLKESNVRVNALSPLAATRMGQTSRAYLQGKGLQAPASTQPPAETNAPVVVYLLSDASAHVTGQVVRIEGKQLSLVSHPGVSLPVLEREQGWDVASVAQAFRDDLGKRQFPTGIVGLKVEVVGPVSPYWKSA